MSARVRTASPGPALARRGSSRGFSLIELLVVIIIIGIVAALAIPTMAVAQYDRHAYEDAGSMMMLFRQARTRALARGGAVLIEMNANGMTDRGTLHMYEAVAQNVNGGQQRTPQWSCKAPTNWQPLSNNPNVLLVDGVNINNKVEVQADIETAMFVYPSPNTNVPTPFPTGYVCYTPLGRSYVNVGGGAQPVFTGMLPTVSPIELRVTRAGGGTIRSVLVPPNGMARLWSHV